MEKTITLHDFGHISDKHGIISLLLDTPRFQVNGFNAKPGFLEGYRAAGSSESQKREGLDDLMMVLFSRVG